MSTSLAQLTWSREHGRYDDLNQQSEQIENYLRDLAVFRGTLVVRKEGDQQNPKVCVQQQLHKEIKLLQVGTPCHQHKSRVAA